MHRRFLLLCLAGACSSAPPAPKRDATPTATPAATPGALDEGKYVLTAGDATLGEETFSIIEKKELGFETKSSTKLNLGEQKIEQTSTVTLDAKGAPAAMTVESKQGDKQLSAKVSRKDGKLVGETGGKSIPEQRPSDLIIADGFVAHWAPMCALAGAERRSFSVFPGLPLLVEPVVTRKMQIIGKEGQPTREAEITSVIADYAGVRIELACDGVRLMSLFQPTTGVLAARPGFEVVARRLAVVNRPKPVVPDTLVEEDRTVTAGDAALSCSLILPKERKKKVPAVVFIGGSGPQDRDGDTPGGGGIKLAVFKDMAIALGQTGIGSLRCDDRGVGRSTGEFQRGTLDTWVGDTRAAVTALRGEGSVDERRIGLVGHSEGAVVAPIVAGADRQLKAVVLMAGPGRRFDELLLEQIAARAKRSGGSDADAAKQVEETRLVMEAVRKGTPFPESLGAQVVQLLESQRGWLASHAKHDPLAAVSRLKIPVFVAHGARDVQVQVRDAEALRDALAKGGNKRLTYKVYDDLNHLFAQTKTGSVADYGDRNAKVDGTFVTDVVAFLTKAL